MCDHSKSTYLIEKASDLKSEPTDPATCHIYYVHQKGEILCEPNVRFGDEQDQEVTRLNGSDKNKDNLFCGEDRLTLIHLPAQDFKGIMDLDTPDGPQTTEAGPQTHTDHWPDPSLIPMPEYFKEKLKNICPYCHCKGDILWRNLHRIEPRFDACFRYFDGNPAESGDPAGSANPGNSGAPAAPTKPTEEDLHRRCFLKLYTLKVPFLAQQTVALSLVHHVRAEGKDFVPPRPDSTNKEHIFGFIAGFTSLDLGRLLTELFRRWQDISADHFMKATAGKTPRLFMAAVISQYGRNVADEVIRSGRTLIQCDKALQTALQKLNSVTTGPSGDVTFDIARMNETLINMNINLTGTRSTMHYLADSAHTLVSGVSTFEQYIQARLLEWKENSDADALKDSLLQLDSCKESIRDKDKLELVRKTMLQYKVDIKSLQQHIDINVGMVRNLIAERDKVIQNVIAGNTARDGFIMKIISVLTALFLPGTFMAIFLASPMFDFKNADSVVVDFPTKLYWSIAGTITFLLIIGQLFLAFPEWTTKAVEAIGWDILEKSRLYTDSKERSAEKDKLIMERNTWNSVVRRGTDESQLSGKTQTMEGHSLSNTSAPKTTEPANQNGELQNGQQGLVSLPLERVTQPVLRGEALV